MLIGFRHEDLVAKNKTSIPSTDRCQFKGYLSNKKK